MEYLNGIQHRILKLYVGISNKATIDASGAKTQFSRMQLVELLVRSIVAIVVAIVVVIFTSPTR